MKTRRWILGVLILSGWTAPQLQAQTFTLPFNLTQSSPALTFSLDSNGTFTETGPLNSSATFTFSSNPEMVWFPALGAFRAGSFSGTGSQTTIGQNSVAFGHSTASGYGSTAFGYSVASNAGSTAFGSGATASGSYSTAMGDDVTASGFCSTAFGNFSVAIGGNSTAIGNSTASGLDSAAVGCSRALGDYSFSGGNSTSANSYESFVVGAYNTGLSETGTPTPTLTSWVSTDPLFEVGNGQVAYSPYTVTHSDALVIYKDGNAVLQGSLKVAPSGDIPMYMGN